MASSSPAPLPNPSPSPPPAKPCISPRPSPKPAREPQCFPGPKPAAPAPPPSLIPPAQNPAATFSAPGTYVLRLTCTVAPTVAFAERTVIVQPPEGTGSTNPLPNISPGTAPAATVGTAADLTGTASNATSTAWQKISGPGNVIFADAAAPTTTATFDRAGTYLLRLSASNSNGTSSADLTVIVSHADAFSAWQELQWGTETDPTIIGPNADPDADGLANLAEFYAATDPKSASSTAPNLWSATTTGPPLPWSNSAHWTYAAPPVAGSATALEFLTNQTLAAGTITANHDLASPFNLNLLTLNGTSSEAARLHLTGNTLQFSTNGSHHSRPQPQRHRHAGLSDRHSHHPQRQHHHPRQRHGRL